jgi:exonuclease VII small subunit
VLSLRHAFIGATLIASVAVTAPVGAQDPTVSGDPPPVDTTVVDSQVPAPTADPVPEPEPPALDVAAILTLEAARRDAAILEATRAADASQRAAQERVDAAAASAADADVALDAASGAHGDAEAALERADAELERARDRVKVVAVEGFSSSSSVRDPMLSAVFGDSDLADASNSTVYAAAAADAATSTMAAARADRDRARRTAAAAAEELADAEEAAAEARHALSKAQTDLDATVAANTEAIAAAGALIDTPVNAGGPKILGPSVVSAADMAAFVRARGLAHRSVDVEELAELFVTEGAAEGVAGDIAWIQSIIETGWFGYRNSMVDPGDHNYAGIGACDSCRRGYIFSSPRDGARAQMQLLRIYATPGLRSADLAHPPVRSTPERVGVRGCCGTWMELSGVWATGPGYGVKILTLYNDMLAFAAARRTS